MTMHKLLQRLSAIGLTLIGPGEGADSATQAYFFRFL